MAQTINCGTIRDSSWSRNRAGVLRLLCSITTAKAFITVSAAASRFLLRIQNSIRKQAGLAFFSLLPKKMSLCEPTIALGCVWTEILALAAEPIWAMSSTMALRRRGYVLPQFGGVDFCRQR